MNTNEHGVAEEYASQQDKPACEPEPPKKSSVLRVTLIGAIVAVACGIGIFVACSGTDAQNTGGNNESAANSTSPADGGAEGHGGASGNLITVETIHPRRDPKGFVRAESQPTYVQGFFTADLMARVPGTVKSIEKNIGDSVKAGETLVELDAPDLVQDLAQKEAAVAQAQQDFKAAQTALIVAQASAKTQLAMVKQFAAAEAHSAALEKFHQEEYERYRVLASKEAVVGNVLDEKLRDLEAAHADSLAANAATDTARAKSAEYSAKVDEARVDIDVKQAKVAVAVSDRDHAKAMVDFTKIKAPFDGLIVARMVDPGSFVQSAGSGHATLMLRVVRTDVVTFVTFVPEKDAPLVSDKTPVSIKLDALGDEPVRSTVTRYSHWLDPDKSRDMRVEVDYDNRAGQLKPGMYGTMTLALADYSSALLVPACSVFASGGQTYVYEVNDGRATRVPVRVQYQDGVQAKIVTLVRTTDPKTGRATESAEDPTERDEIVRSGQGELADGQPVKPVNQAVGSRE